MQGEFVADSFSNAFATGKFCAKALRIALRLMWPSFGCHLSHESLSSLNLLLAEQIIAVFGKVSAGFALTLAMVLAERAAAIAPTLSLLRLPPGRAPVTIS